MGGRLDPGAEIALTMADVHAGEGDYPEALAWLELASERGSLGSTDSAKHSEWITRVRRDPTDGQPRARRRAPRPQLPGA